MLQVSVLYCAILLQLSVQNISLVSVQGQCECSEENHHLALHSVQLEQGQLRQFHCSVVRLCHLYIHWCRVGTAQIVSVQCSETVSFLHTLVQSRDSLDSFSVVQCSETMSVILTLVYSQSRDSSDSVSVATVDCVTASPAPFTSVCVTDSLTPFTSVWVTASLTLYSFACVTAS